MISKKTFVDAIKEIQNFTELEDDLNNLIKKYYKYADFISLPNLQDTLIRVIEEDMGLEDNVYYGTDISYFIYDLNFGSDWKPGMITDKDGNDIDFSTAEKLYDYLTQINNCDK